MAFSEITPLETVTLEDALHDGVSRSRVCIAPGRGGIVTRFDVGELRVLYLDEATLLDETKNVRGGNPVLFPAPGPLAGDRFTWNGTSGSMKQHGIARLEPWTVEGVQQQEATLVLSSNERTRAAFPWDFEVRFRYRLDGPKLRIEQRYKNQSTTEMPFSAGFHPYFYVPQAAKGAAKIPTKATRGWDNVQKRDVDVKAPIDLTAKEVDLHLFDHAPPGGFGNRATLEFGDGSKVIVSASAEFGRWVVWTLAGKDFVCLEPWTSPANALNTGDHLLVVGPGEERALWTEIALL